MNKTDGYSEMVLSNLGSRLKFLREHYKVRIERLCEILGVARTQYYLYEKGQSQLGIVGIKRLADFYNVSLDALLNNHVALTNSAVFFKLHSLDPLNEVKDEGKVYISDENSSISFVKRNDEYLVFESIQDTIYDNDTYFIEYDSLRYVARVIVPEAHVVNKKFELMLFLDDKKPIFVKRNEVFFLGRLIGKYQDLVKNHFIKN